MELRKFVDLGKLCIPGNPFGTGFLVALLICEVFAESQREGVNFNLKRSKQRLERQMGQCKVKMDYKIQQLDLIYRVIQQINNFITYCGYQFDKAVTKIPVK